MTLAAAFTTTLILALVSFPFSYTYHQAHLKLNLIIFDEASNSISNRSIKEHWAIHNNNAGFSGGLLQTSAGPLETDERGSISAYLTTHGKSVSALLWKSTSYSNCPIILEIENSKYETRYIHIEEANYKVFSIFGLTSSDNRPDELHLKAVSMKDYNFFKNMKLSARMREVLNTHSSIYYVPYSLCQL